MYQCGWLEPEFYKQFIDRDAGCDAADGVEQLGLVWADRAGERSADAPGGAAKYVGVFNTADTAKKVDLPWAALGLTAGSRKMRDLWAKQAVPAGDGVHVELRPHASMLYRVEAP